MLVVDASILAPAVADGGAEGESIRRRLRGQVIVGPDLLRLEVLSVVRRHRAAGHFTTVQADHAIQDLLALPIRVFPTAPLLGRAWELRDNVSAYGACYIALAEVLDAPLVTGDQRLANAPGTRCAVEVIT